MRSRARAAALAAAGCALAACGPTDGAAPEARRIAAERPAGEAMSPAQAAFSEANSRMHAGMGRIDEDADVAFMEGMIAHHQGAIDMANAVLRYGDDESARDLARRVIAAQGEEIAEIRAWLARNGRAATPADPADHPPGGH